MKTKIKALMNDFYNKLKKETIIEKREMSDGWVSLCLPFILSETDNEQIHIQIKYDNDYVLLMYNTKSFKMGSITRQTYIENFNESLLEFINEIQILEKKYRINNYR